MDIPIILIANSAFLFLVFIILLISSLVLSAREKKKEKDTLNKIKKQISS